MGARCANGDRIAPKPFHLATNRRALVCCHVFRANVLKSNHQLVRTSTKCCRASPASADMPPEARAGRTRLRPRARHACARAPTPKSARTQRNATPAPADFVRQSNTGRRTERTQFVAARHPLGSCCHYYHSLFTTSIIKPEARQDTSKRGFAEHGRHQIL